MAWARLPSGKNPSRETPSWTESQVERIKRQQNPEVDRTNSGHKPTGREFMSPNSQEERFQVDKHPDGQTPKKTDPNVSRIQTRQNQ